MRHECERMLNDWMRNQHYKLAMWTTCRRKKLDILKFFKWIWSFVVQMANSSHVTSPEAFGRKGDLSQVSVWWQRWKRGFEYYPVARGNIEDGHKHALLLHYAGLDVQDIFELWMKWEQHTEKLVPNWMNISNWQWTVFTRGMCFCVLSVMSTAWKNDDAVFNKAETASEIMRLWWLCHNCRCYLIDDNRRRSWRNPMCVWVRSPE